MCQPSMTSHSTRGVQIAPAVLSPAECSELIAVHKALSVVGYRTGVFSTTIYDVASVAPQLLVPMVHARQLVWDKVEAMFGLSCELHVEFTGLISWTQGSSLGWHADNNREYLNQRHFSSVLYLNSAQQQESPVGEAGSGGVTGGPLVSNSGPALQIDGAAVDGIGFTGGDLCFQAGSPRRVTPSAGTLVAYSSDDGNVHMVEEVLSGERFTLTMWFTRLADHREDGKVLQLLSNQGVSSALKPLSIPSSMYLQDGCDTRVRRLGSLGLQVRNGPLRISGARQGISGIDSGGTSGSIIAEGTPSSAGFDPTDMGRCLLCLPEDGSAPRPGASARLRSKAAEEEIVAGEVDLLPVNKHRKTGRDAPSTSVGEAHTRLLAEASYQAWGWSSVQESDPAALHAGLTQPLQTLPLECRHDIIDDELPVVVSLAAACSKAEQNASLSPTAAHAGGVAREGVVDHQGCHLDVLASFPNLGTASIVLHLQHWLESHSTRAPQSSCDDDLSCEMRCQLNQPASVPGQFMHQTVQASDCCPFFQPVHLYLSRRSRQLEAMVRHSLVSGLLVPHEDCDSN